MLSWHEYIDYLMNTTRKSRYGKIKLSLNSGKNYTEIPPIIKASMIMLDRMQKYQGIFNIFVFPERIQSIFIFTIIKLLHNISVGRIDGAYNPETFTPGEHLMIGNTVAEFLGFEVYNDVRCMKIRLADMTINARPELFPFFQKTKAKRLNKYKKYTEAVNNAMSWMEGDPSHEYFLYILNNFKTHMDKSIFYMTSIVHTKELIRDCYLSGKPFSELVLIGQADYTGNIHNTGPGQLGGTPAIVLASDLYAISAAASKGYDIQSVIIDASNGNTLISQMDALDEVLHLGVPVTCVTDAVNSFELDQFQKRGFNIWRWDKNTITEKLYKYVSLNSDNKIKNCANSRVDYIYSECNEISMAMKLLYVHRKVSLNFSAQMIKIFEKLFSLAFTALWETVPFDDEQRAYTENRLNECADVLEEEKRYISPDMYEDYCNIIRCLRKVYDRNYILQKNIMMEQFLSMHQQGRVALVISERSDKNRVQTYWQKWCRNNAPDVKVRVFHPAEYYLIPCNSFSVTLVVGWLKRAIMRKILFSYNTECYSVLLYEYEKRWKNYSVSKWNSVLDKSQNAVTVRKSFETDNISISMDNFASSVGGEEKPSQHDEFAEIEQTLRENRYRQYTLRGGQKSAGETVEAVPVNYVGGYLAFYRTSHKLISAGSIVENDDDKIESKLPGELRIGDFVVVRVSDQDLIMEMADVMLERSGQKELRKLASLWKDSLLMASVFHSQDEIYERLRKAGCTRGYQTVRGWITDRDMIAPQSRLDLEHIAEATESGVLKEKIDQVYNAAQIVRARHVQAGRELSLLLKKRIVTALKEYGDVDLFNIWEPIEMQVEGVGLVRILKVIDIGKTVTVDIADTNRIIEE